MATIITVHGTGATGPEEGDRWWQKGSPFEKHIRELVEGEDGELVYEPFIWDGANSETSRRAGGERLFARLKDANGPRNSYCAIGHSHGGSVIANALLLAASKKNRLPHWFLFPRLGLFGKSAYLCALVWSAAALAFTNREVGLKPLQTLFAVAPFLFIYCLLWLQSAREYRIHWRSTRKYCEAHYSKRWAALWHSHDEALRALQSVNRARFRLFKPHFAVPMFSMASIFVIPMIILLFDYSSTFDGCIAKVLHLDPDDLLFRVGVAHLTLLGVVYLSDQLGIAESPMVVELVFIAAIPVVVFSISLLFTLAATKLSGGTSAALSRYAGHVTWKQVRARAYGTDTAGEWAGEASGRPSWVDAGFLPVPEALSQELNRFSDEEAAKSISEFRIAMGQLRLFEDEQGNVAPPEFNWDGPNPYSILQCAALSKARGLRDLYRRGVPRH